MKAVLSTSGYVDSTQEAGDGPVGLVLDRTSFYADGGGQATDVGVIAGSSGSLDVEHVEVRLHWNVWCLWQQVLKDDVCRRMLGPSGGLSDLRSCQADTDGQAGSDAGQCAGPSGKWQVEQVRCAALIWDIVNCKGEVLLTCSVKALIWSPWA